MQSSASDQVKPRSSQRAEETRAVAAILEQIPELLKVTQVRKRDGSLVAFAPEKIGSAIAAVLKSIGVNDDLILARCTHQVLMRIDREFDGTGIPATDDVARIVAVVFVDNNLPHAVKKFFEKRVKGSEAKRIISKGVKFRRRFTRADVHPYDAIEWENRDAVITNEKGKTVFEQRGVEFPKSWSQTATNIVVSKYFRGEIGQPERETSVRQMIDRVAGTIVGWGREGGYFASTDDADIFEAELTDILVTQKAAFNSPVWFNVGVNERPQCSACFINSVRDDMRSILSLAVTEGMLFKYGSGTGSNLSTLRSSKEKLAHSSGRSSGPVSFMKGFDAFAGVIKSGGKTRRAAKMVILNIDHPDVEEFVECKAKEEKKAYTLIANGYDGSIDGDAYSSIFFQNANNSVRVTDDFMRAYEADGEWETKAVTNGEPVDRLRARALMRKIAQAAWECGDPGMQYDTTVNRWNPVSNSGRINASNPCVTGDTLVATDGGYRRMVDLVGTEANIVDANGNVSLVTKIFPTGRKTVYELRTKSGYNLKLTGDHRVWTKNRGDVPASGLREGDTVELRRPGFGEASLNGSLAEAIGLAVGDGCLTKGQEAVFITGDKEEYGMLSILNDRLHEHKREVSTDGRAKRWSGVAMTATTARIGTSSRAIVEPMKKYAVLDQGSHEKRFTDEVFALDKDTQAAMLRGLFSADGTVADYGEKSQYVALDSTALPLLRQVQLLLLAFDIKAKIYENRRPESQTEAMLPDGKGGMAMYPVRQVHSLRISRDSRVKFASEIGFVHGSPKTEALARLNEGVGVYKDAMTDEFMSLTELGEEDVYDLTEPVTNHFVANGIVVHNCSEYMFLDDTACNLASLNLMKFRREDGEFDVEAYRHATEIVITAMEILVGNSSYPTPAIEENSFAYRPLGIGYANLGALLMSRGLAYDSEEGRNFAAAITAVLSGRSYAQSARVADALGPFTYYKLNEKPFLKVIGMHRDHAYAIVPKGVPADLAQEARRAWDDALELGMAHGYKNAQISVLAPTGTIGFLMDCDTTGIEPDIALVKYKWLVGGGLMKIVNSTVPEALSRLGYDEAQVAEILAHVDAFDTIEAAPHLKPEHLSVFDCAFKPAKGTRSIAYMGHIRMMAAVQPFLSGAISKTVNLPNEATVQDVEDAYVQGWKLGLKAIAIYRDGSKGQQVLTVTAEKNQDKKPTVIPATRSDRSIGQAGIQQPVSVPAPAPVAATAQVEARVEYRPLRRRLPDERQSLTHKFAVGGHEGYITVGLYDDGQPGELFIRMSKGGSVISGLIDSLATSVSLALQYGVPLKVLVNKFAHVRFEPSGYTNNPSIRIAKSIVDYLFRWMALKFLSLDDQRAVGVNVDAPTLAEVGESDVAASANVPPTATMDPNGVTQVAAPASATPEPVIPAPWSDRSIGQAGIQERAPVAPAVQEIHLRGTVDIDRSKTANAMSMSFDLQADAPACDMCGAIMIRNAACYKCLNCGSSSGCS